MEVRGLYRGPRSLYIISGSSGTDEGSKWDVLTYIGALDGGSRCHMWALTGYPQHRENREYGKKKSLSGKTQGILKFYQSKGNFF